MSAMMFTIPANRTDLLNELTNNYAVRNIAVIAELAPNLEAAKKALREEGPSFILDHFDTYYSILHRAENVRSDILSKAYNHLQKATGDLNDTIFLLLEERENLTPEIKSKMVIVIKMLLYIFIQFVFYLEEKKKKSQQDIVGKNKNKEKVSDIFTVDKSKVLATMNNVLQRQINLFWEPPVVENDFVNLIADLAFGLLQNPSIKVEKEVILEIFGVLGHLVKDYDYGSNFVSRLIRTIRLYEHVAQCIPEALKMLVEQFHCESLVHHFITEATEWQVEQTYQDIQGTRCCSTFLCELAVVLPELVLKEVAYLNKYLAHESIPLRVAVLTVINEIILQVLTKHDLTQEEKELREECFTLILEHIRDHSAVVRCKVIQNFTKLQKTNAIPLSLQNVVLKTVIQHLTDRGAAVRKAAILCVTTFLQHNPYGANLQMRKIEQQLSEKKELLNKMESAYKEAELAKIKQVEEEWAKIAPNVEEIVKHGLKEDDDEREDEEELTEEENKEAADTIRNLLKEGKLIDSFKYCRRFKEYIEQCQDVHKSDDIDEVNVYVTLLRSFYVNSFKIVEELRTKAGMTKEDMQKIEVLEGIIKYFGDTKEFLKILHSAIEPMKSLLFSAILGDAQEAINFFVTAFQFQIDHASDGILEMLKLMRCPEQERRNTILNAFKSIYLTTDSNNMNEHTTIVVDRLLSLLKTINYDNLDDFESIITEWTIHGILDNGIIDRCWQYFTQRESVSNDDARAAAELLRMCALGRNTIITKNIGVVSKIACDEKHKNDMRFLASAFRLLAVAGDEKIDVQSEKSPLKINHEDEIFQKIVNALVEKFFEKDEYYSEAMKAELEVIFRLSSKPIQLGEMVVQKIIKKMENSPKSQFLIIRLCELLGCISMKLLDYLDNTVYRELKRRNYLREERKKESKGPKDSTVKKKRNKKRESTVLETTISEAGANESVLMGADAEDEDAEFILKVLENDIVFQNGILSQCATFLIKICQRPDLYDNQLLQKAAITAVMRFMLVSSKFCQGNIRLLFTILEKTTYPELKCTILIHCADLLTRFPNVVEPWSDRIYAMLQDPLVKVRRTAFFTLANLILRAMIRAHSHISEMAACLIDQDEEVSGMCKNFLERLSHKENNLVNVIPDIFAHLVRREDISEDNLRFILKFMFDLVDTSKRMENLVDRFCCKYTPDDNMRLNRNITYSLTLINYNERALKKLKEKFSMYQHHLHDPEIYSYFKQILTECSKAKGGKADLKLLVVELEGFIASVFTIDGNGQRKPPIIPKSVKKTNTRKKNKRETSESDNEESDNGRPRPKNKKSNNTNRKKNQRVVYSDSSDSDSSPGRTRKSKTRRRS